MQEFRYFIGGNRNCERGGIVVTVKPENGRVAKLSVLMLPGSGMPLCQTGDGIFLPHVEENYAKGCFKNRRFSIIGIYEGDDINGVAKIEWRQELKDYSAKSLNHKPISICDPAYFKILEELAEKDAAEQREK
jgi:hypothetical protein